MPDFLSHVPVPPSFPRIQNRLSKNSFGKLEYCNIQLRDIVTCFFSTVAWQIYSLGCVLCVFYSMQTMCQSKIKKNILIQKKPQKHVVVFWLIGLLFVFKKERLNGAPKLRVALIFPDVFIIISSFFTHIIECWSVPTSKDILENIVPYRPI